MRTERLTLRPLGDADLPLLRELDEDPAVTRYAEPASDAEALAWMLERPQFWIAYEGDAFVGWFFLRDSELGYRLQRSAWGRGLATEGCRAILTEEPAWAEADAGHIASQNVLRKLGFVNVGGERWER